MLGHNLWRGSQVGNGAGNAEHPVISSGRPLETGHRRLQQGFASLVWLAVTVNLACRQQVVRFALAGYLYPVSFFYPLGDGPGGFPISLLGQFIL